MAGTAGKKFRLSLVNAAEDVPRVIRAYGRACDGEFALVLRPPEERGVLVLVTKTGATSWRSNDGDSPAVPEVAITAKDAVALVRTEQKAVPKPGPITLRGQWSGWMRCDGGAPRVELTRKLAAYGVLRIESGAGGWTWTIERTEKWFSKPGADTGTASTLLKAIEGGLARAMGLIGEACSVRDSRRRAALDSAYAVEHPVKPAREGKDPTERMKAKEPRARKPRASQARAAEPEAGGVPRPPRVGVAPENSPWAWFEGEPPEADPLERPSRAVKSALRRGGLVHDEGAGSFLGRTVVAHGAYPAGALVFRPADGGGFWMAAAVERAAPARAAAPTGAAAPARAGQPKRSRATKAEPAVDATKDKALLDAFSAAIATAWQDGF